MKKRGIWSNINLDIDDWRDDYKEYLEYNGFDKYHDNDADLYNWMTETNNEYLDDERINLDKLVDGKILVIGDLGRWNGRVQGYKIIDSCNIRDILFSDCDYSEWYSDGYDIRSTHRHHDGVNFLLYRVIREDRYIENLLDAIYRGEEISRSKLNYYTKSLHRSVADIYGW